MKTNKNQSFKMPRDFDGIEEVQETTERSASPVVNGGLVQFGEIAEVTKPSPKTIGVISGGTISSWEISEASHKTKMRTIITAVTLALWVILTVMAIITFSQTGNLTLLITSPAAATGIAIYKILAKIVAYYYS